MTVKRLKTPGKDNPNRANLKILRELWKALKAKGVLADEDIPAKVLARLDKAS